MCVAPQSVCGVILVTSDVDRLVDFYRTVLGLELQPEEHAGLPCHYGIDIGSTHFGIHPPESFGLETAKSGGSVIALQVKNLDATLQILENRGVTPLIEKDDEGFGPRTTIQDPDGNLIELVELRYDFGRELCG